MAISICLTCGLGVEATGAKDGGDVDVQGNPGGGQTTSESDPPALADQSKRLDWRARQAELAARLPEDGIAEILAKAATLLA